MIRPGTRPKRKNPILPTRQPLLPPSIRSRAALGLTAAAARGGFELQVCEDCGVVQYPPREVCGACLSSRLQWTPQSGAGELLADTTLHHSHDLFFRERLPWRLGLVRLDAGPTVVTHLHGDCPPAPARIRVGARLDQAGQGVLIAFPIDEAHNMADDPQLREMTSDPRLRKVLVTDGRSLVGQAIVRALVAAEADIIWVGHCEPWKRYPGFESLATLAPVTFVPLDVTNARSVEQVAAEIGGRVDILVNTAEVHRTHGIASRPGTDAARAEMDVNYFGLLRLAQAFSPAMKARAADGQSNATAWVNLLSIYALSSFPAHGTFSASKAAAHSLSQCLRAEMRPAGIRVLNLFPGPIDDEWNQTTPAPKLAPEALARALVAALKDGVEDAYPGDIAQEWLARWLEHPKTLERELAV
jgi:NAD(P)-dependent dehydrogenase (short-subunit alcohol dehydrogenase family)/uncharacterized OB-fold protein